MNFIGIKSQKKIQETRAFGGGLFLSLLPVLLPGLWGALPLAAQAAQAAKTFVYCSEANPSTLDPATGYDGAAATAGAQTIFDRLIQFKKGTTEIEPGLATKWEVSKDGKTYTFELRKGVKWHSNELFKPSREMNADDVIFTFERMRRKDHPFHKLGGGHYEYFSAMGFDQLIEEIKKLDDHKVQFVLNRPEAPFLASLGMDFASISSKEYAETLRKLGKEDEFVTRPIGTGPFVFKKFVKDQLIRFEANPDYWQGRSPLDRLVFVITPDPSVRYQKLKAGECHLAAYPAPSDLEAMRKDPNIRVESKPGMNVGFLAFNVKKKPFDNRDVRLAIYMALNRKAYIEAIYLGNGVVAKNPMPPTLWGYNTEVQDYEYNRQKAKELLAKAGYPNGFETELWTLPVSRPYNPNGKKMGEMMQADLAKIGIKVELVTFDWPTYLEKTSAGEHALAQFGWSGDNGDPDNFLDTLLSCSAIKSGSNRSRWCNPEYEKLVKEARRTPNQKIRAEKYRKAQLIFKKEIPWVTLAHGVLHSAMSKRVTGFTIDPMAHDIFYGVDLK